MTDPTRDEIVMALQDAWNDFCDDAKAFPDCFTITRGPKLWADFQKGNFAQMVADALTPFLTARESAIRAEERERAAVTATMFTLKPDRSIHPDIPWDKMNETAKMIAHTTAQQIAYAIRSLPDEVKS